MIAMLALSSPVAAQKAAITDADRALAREIVTELVAYRTAKGQGQVPTMIAAMTTRLKAAGFADDDIQIVPVDIAGEKTAGFVVRYRGTGKSGLSPVRADVFDAIRRAVHVNYPGAPVKPSMSSGGTDGREYRSAGIPTYGAGSLALVRIEDSRAHGANERLLLSSYDKELAFWDTLLRDLGSQGGRR